MRVDLPNGLYQVTTNHFVAGFVVQRRNVVQCAPILRNRLEHWATLARRISA